MYSLKNVFFTFMVTVRFACLLGV